jgi:hypothetical protein
MVQLDKNDLKTLPRYVYVQWPFVQDYQDYEDFEDHSICDPDFNGACIEERWLIDHTPDHEGCSYQELADWGDEFDKYFNVERDYEEGVDESLDEARGQYLHERETGEVSSIEEFAEKYRL